MYIGKDEIREIKDTDKISPLGNKVFTVEFYTELDLIHTEIDEARERQNELLDQRSKVEGEEQQKIDDLIAEYTKKEEELDKKQDTAQQEPRIIYATQKMIDNCQSEQPNDEYYHKRRQLIVKELLEILSEWGIEKVELIPILQLTEQSTRENEIKATGKLFKKDIPDINLLDYHYAILGQN